MNKWEVLIANNGSWPSWLYFSDLLITELNYKWTDFEINISKRLKSVASRNPCCPIACCQTRPLVSRGSFQHVVAPLLHMHAAQRPNRSPSPPPSSTTSPSPTIRRLYPSMSPSCPASPSHHHQKPPPKRGMKMEGRFVTHTWGQRSG